MARIRDGLFFLLVMAIGTWAQESALRTTSTENPYPTPPTQLPAINPITTPDPRDMYELAPAAPEPTDHWPVKFLCLPDQYIHGGIVTIERLTNAASSTQFEPFCKAAPGIDDVCSGYAVGMMAEWIPNHGVTLIRFECENRVSVKVLDRKSECLKGSQLQPRRTCKEGYGVCGYQSRDDFLENFRLTCCQLKYQATTSKPTITIENTVYDVVGPLNPDKGLNEKTRTTCNKFAYGLEVINRIPSSFEIPIQQFNLKCGFRHEIDRNDCPWYMNGVEAEIIEKKHFYKIYIHCYDGSKKLVYKNSSFDSNGKEAKSKRFYCRDGEAVCGYIMDKDFLNNFAFICCQLNKENILHTNHTFPPIIRWEQLFKDEYQVGLTNIRTDAKLTVKDFNQQANPIVIQILKSIKQQLIKDGHKPELIEMEDFTVVNKYEDGIFSNTENNTFQLTASYSNYKFRLNCLKKVARDCDEVEEASGQLSNVLDCACTFPNKTYTKRNCTYRWRLYAIGSEKEMYNRRYEEEHKFLVKNRFDNADISLGLVKRPITLETAPLNTYEFWKKYKQSSGIIETIEEYLCPFHLGSIKSFDYTKRVEQQPIKFRQNSTDIYLYFQLVAKCNAEKFIIFFDRYQTILFNDGTTWEHIDVHCEIPLQEGVLHHRVRYHCRKDIDASKVDFKPPPTPPPTTAMPTRGSTFQTTRAPYTYPSTTTGMPKVEKAATKFFLLDGSKNVSQSYFDKAKEFIKYYVRGCPDKRYVVIEYSDETKVYYLGQDPETVLHSIQRSGGEERNSDWALKDVQQAIMRYKIQKGKLIVIHILFGEPADLGETNKEIIGLILLDHVVMSIYIQPKVEEPDDSDEFPAPPPQVTILATDGYNYKFESPENLLGNASKITCKMCGTNGPKLRGEHIFILLDVAKADYNGSEKAFNDTMNVLAEFVSETCQDNVYSLVTFDDKDHIPISAFNSGTNMSKVLLNTTQSSSTIRQGNLAFDKAELLINTTIRTFSKKRYAPPTSILYVGFGQTKGMKKILGITARLSKVFLSLISPSPWSVLMGFGTGNTSFRAIRLTSLTIAKNRTTITDGLVLSQFPLDCIMDSEPVIQSKLLTSMDCQICR